MVSISDASPTFVYSVGLNFSFNHPEMIIFGLARQGSNILRVMMHEIKAGKSFAEPAVYDGVVVNGLIATRRVHPSQHEFYLGYAMGYCRERGRIGQLEAIQVFWPDKAGKFPFERECDELVWAAQPRLDQQVCPDVLRERRREQGTP